MSSRGLMAGVALALAGLTSGIASAQPCTFSMTLTPNPQQGSSPGAVAAADFSGDGRSDVVHVNTLGANLSLYHSNPAGDLEFVQFIPTSANPMCIAAADFNNDGRMDLAVGHQTLGARVILWTEQGWNGSLTLPAVTAGRDIVTGDFNADGHTDLAVLNRDAGLLVVAQSNGLGAFSLVTYPTPSGRHGLAAGDMTLDGRTDLVVTSNTSVRIYHAGPGGLLTPAQEIVDGVAYPGPVLADFTGDGLPDMIAGRASAGGFALFRGYGIGRLDDSEHIMLAGIFANTLCVADFNLDGHADVVVSGEGGQSQHTAMVLLGNGQGGFTSSLYGVTRQGRVAVGDFNADGRPDAAFSIASEPQMQLLRNTTTGLPAITAEPVPVQVAPGQPAVFTVSAAGFGLTRQWRRNGEAIPAGQPGYTGQQGATLTLLAPTAADNAAVFDCIVANVCGSVRSRAVGLAVVDPCGSADFNGDGDTATDADIEAFFRVLAGGSC